MSFSNFIRSRKAVRTLSLTLIVVTVLAIFVEDADARRKRRRRSRVKRAVIHEPKLYERLGGAKALNGVVDDWVRASLADARLNGVFGDVTAKPDLLAKLRKNLNDQLCEISDGPCGNPSSTNKTAFDFYLLPDAQFVVFADHLVQVLDTRLVKEREKNELLGGLGAARYDVLPDAEAEEGE
ncbi:MAG TPA: hypothetical protein VM432_05230 [Bdellovibrionales bacterium]|jgi:hemoglobin|nr:hypothetical protein [Bdellovibrionales bacterium]